MIPTMVLAKLLPALALVGLALTGIEGLQGASAHSPARRGPSHKHLAARSLLEQNVGAQEKKKRVVIRRRADGTQCRVKGGSPFSSSASAVATSSASPAPASSAAAATTQAPAAAAVSQAAPTQNNQNWAAASPAASPAAAPAQASKAATVAVSSGGAWGGWTNVHSKLGHAWPNGNWAGNGQSDYIGNYIGSKASWYYTWSPHNVGNGDALGLEFVPMLWGPHQVGDFWALQGSWPSTVKNALFFNEPNEGSQCNVAAGDAVKYWMNDFLPLRRKGIRLGGAAPTNAPSGLQWSLDFEKLCVQYGNSKADCTPDFIPVHWYSKTVQNFQQYVTNYHNQVGHNLWVTEYACHSFSGEAQCTDAETWQLHQTMAEWFDQQDYIERYSPFGVMKQMQGVNQNNALMNPDGSITSLGNWYIWNS